MSVTMKKSRLVELWRALDTLSSRSFSTRFAYGISLNRKKMRPIIEALDECVQPDKEYDEYDKERKELLQEMSAKDEHNKPLEEERENAPPETILKDYMAYQTAVKELQEKHREAFDKQKEKLDIRADMLEEETEFKAHKIKLSYLPKVLEMGYVDILEPLIEDDTEEVDKRSVLEKEIKGLREEVKTLKEEIKDKKK